MMSEGLEQAVAGLPLGALRYFDCLTSTQTEAARWAEAEAPDLALVVANEQTAGRGRQGRRWFTPPGSGLAFSLVLRQFGSAGQAGGGTAQNQADLPIRLAHLAALGALAVCRALRSGYNLPAQIKWPNDVLLEGCKVAGVLVEAHWQGDQPSAAVLGIGINVSAQSIPPVGAGLRAGSGSSAAPNLSDSPDLHASLELPDNPGLSFPATCIEAVLRRPLPRWELLRAVLVELVEWRERLGSHDFLQAWEQLLAFKGQWVYISNQSGSQESSFCQGQLTGLDGYGRLRLRDRNGEEFILPTGELTLRPASQQRSPVLPGLTDQATGE